MSDEQLSTLIGHPVENGLAGVRRIFNHRWDDPATFTELGSIPAREVVDLTNGRLREDVPVALNRLATEYDHVLICGPVFPHEVAGFSGGTKYLFPGIAAPGIIHFTHWLGALITSYEVIGTIDTPVRAVIDRAAALLATPISLMALVVSHDGVAGMFCGDVHDAWRRAAMLSARRHIVWVDEPYDRVLAVMPRMYDDLWTAAKGMYKVEPVVAEAHSCANPMRLLTLPLLKQSLSELVAQRVRKVQLEPLVVMAVLVVAPHSVRRRQHSVEVVDVVVQSQP